MIGAIAGDMIGSPYERYPIKKPDFSIIVAGFTDETVLTIAVVNTIHNGVDYADSLKTFATRHYSMPYGRSFKRWMWSWVNKPYNSFGNGSAMQVSPVGFAFDTNEEVLGQAKRSAEVSHKNLEGIKGAQANALAVFIARPSTDKGTIRKEIQARFNSVLDRTVESIRPTYQFDISCQGSVPESIIAFLDADDFETIIKNAISLRGDADTMACIAGGIAQAYYKKIPVEIVVSVRKKLTPDLLAEADRFNQKY